MMIEKKFGLRRLCLRFAILAILSSMMIQPINAQPNIVVILTDDMGFSDLGCYGGEIPTPNLDRMAANGLRFTRFYNTARCCPTRAALLTGLYSHQAGVGHMTADKGKDGFRGDLNGHCVTIAEALRPAGYRNYAVGKWHVTRYDNPQADQHNWPLQRGFDRYYGTIRGGGSYYDPAMLTRGNQPISPASDSDYDPKTFYYTDAITDHSVQFLNDHHQIHPNKPFFLYTAYTAAHWPMHALEEDLKKVRGLYNAGYDAIRQARYAKAKKLGVISDSCALSPTAKDWSKVPASQRDWEIRCMETYAAMVVAMDRGVGRILDALEKNGQLNHTFIVYLQDNGGCAETTGREPDMARSNKPDFPPIKPTDLTLEVHPKQTRDGRSILTGKLIDPGPDDTFIAYGEGWANVSNTPFRLYKHYQHEGGISTPLIAHWPQGIKSKGELRHQPGHLIDIMTTCVEISGASYPKMRQGQSVTPMEGRSLIPAFGNRAIERDAIYWEHEGNRAVLAGDWKLVAQGAAGAWELYNVANDRSEMNNLASKNPQKVQELTAKWEAWAKRVGALPWIWKPAYGQPAQARATRFELKSGEEIESDDAPDLKNHGLTIVVDLVKPGRQGVLVAQGGSSQGFSLYLLDGRPCFAVRQSGKLTIIESDRPLPPDASALKLVWGRDGKLVLEVNGAVWLRGQTNGVLTKQPADGLQVGKDLQGAVSRYSAPFAFDGVIRGVVIETK